MCFSMTWISRKHVEQRCSTCWVTLPNTLYNVAQHVVPIRCLMKKPTERLNINRICDYMKVRKKTIEKEQGLTCARPCSISLKSYALLYEHFGGLST